METGQRQQGIEGEAVASDGEAEGTAYAQALVERYVFGRPHSISKEQMKELAAHVDMYANTLAKCLTRELETGCSVRPVSVEQTAFSEAKGQAGKGPYVCSVWDDSLCVDGRMSLDSGLASAFVDLLLGGVGSAGEERLWTEIDDAVLVPVLQMVVHELYSAGRGGAAQLSVRRNQETMQENEAINDGGGFVAKVACIRLAVQMPLVEGEIHLWLPAKVVAELLRRRNLMAHATRPASAETKARVRSVVLAAKVRCVLQFPPVMLPVREVASLQVGSKLKLPMARHVAAEVRVNGFRLAAARAVRTGDFRGARLQTRAGYAELKARMLN